MKEQLQILSFLVVLSCYCLESIT